MRIGVMLRHYDQHGGGVKVYTREILRSMLSANAGHEFVFLYNNPALLGTYREHQNVTEVVVAGKSVLVWDQIGTPLAVRRHGVEVLYNPKYSIPLAVRCPTAWVCHGLDWYVMPQASRWIDRQSHRFLVPRYANKADAIIAVSEITREHLMQYLLVPLQRVHTIYSGLSEAYNEPPDPIKQQAVRERFKLPERYVLYAGAVYPPKNFTRMVQAYAKVGPQRGIHLVIAGGENRFLSEHELEEPRRQRLDDWVHWAGWVDTDLLPAFYQQAQALLLPSLFESFGLPIIEAMSSGCPVVTSNVYGTREIGEGAAVLVDPLSVDSIAAGLACVLDEPGRRAELIAKGHERARQFSWDSCAAGTLRVLEQIHAERRHKAGRPLP
ncbi:MAG: glycosyltransferase family 4 protein [Sinobacteraceae bacterium]|nr:glycosyltransferase family 4 protein [Nevskiaceae bacterium]